MSEVKEILTDLGYKLKEENGGWRSARLFAGGDNETALKIFPDGRWIDFVQSETGTLEELVAKTIGEDVKSAKIWLKNKDFSFTAIQQNFKPKIQVPKYFDYALLDELKEDFEYWQNRGISKDILKKFRGGIMENDGKLKNRYVFPIFKDNKEDKIVGFAGRSLKKEAKIYWKLIGKKNGWTNFGDNFNAIKALKSVIILESIGDGLSLVEAGLENVLLLHGVELSNEKLTYLIQASPKQIIISLNNDSHKNSVGNAAAEKVKTRLKRYFDQENIQIKLPNFAGCKDWNDVLKTHGKENITNYFNQK